MSQTPPQYSLASSLIFAHSLPALFFAHSLPALFFARVSDLSTVGLVLCSTLKKYWEGNICGPHCIPFIGLQNIQFVTNI